MADQNNILHENLDLISEEDLLKYLEENTPQEEKHAIEEKVIDSGFESDALEGLQQIKAEKVKNNVSFLNQKLQQQLQAKKVRKNKGKIKDFQWILLTILLVLFTCIITFIIIRMRT